MTAVSIAVPGADQRLIETVRRVAAAQQDRPAVHHYSQLGDVPVGAESPAVLVAGPGCGSAPGLRHLTAFRDVAPASSIVMAFERPHVNVREIVRIGADALVDPQDAADVEEAVQRALMFAAARAPAPAPAPTEVAWHAPDAPAAGRVFTVCSATSGCGKTFFATNAAYLLATWSGARVALVDLDLQFGEVTTALRLRVQHSIADALGPGEPQSQTELASHLSGLLTPHDTGIQVLAAPRHPVEADRVTPAEVSRVINALRTTCDYVIVDTPTGLAETVLAALDASEHLFVLAALDLPSVRNLRLFVQTLERLRIPSEGISLILNKAQSGLGIEAGEVARVFNRDFRSILPFAVEVQRSMNVGVPVLSTDPGAEISRGLVHCLADLLPDAARQRCLAAVPEPPRRRGLARFFDMIRGQRPDPSAVGPTVPVPLHPGADV